MHLPALLAAADRPPSELLSALSSLAAARELSLDLGRDGALVWRLERQPEDWATLVEGMAKRLAAVLAASVRRLDACYEALAGAAVYGARDAQERHLRAVIDAYFMEEGVEGATTVGACQAAEQRSQTRADDTAGNDAAGEVVDGDIVATCAAMMPWGAPCPVQRPPRAVLERRVRAALRGVAGRARDLGPRRFGGLALARLLSGLSSPAVPATTWRGCSEWSSLASVDFALLASVSEGVVTEFWMSEAASAAAAPAPGGAGLRRIG